MNIIRAILRLLCFSIVTFSYTTAALITLWLSRGKLESIAHLFKGWAWVNMRILGIQLELKGEFPEEHVLFLSNHRSYIDIIAFPAHCMVVFVAKIEVEKWPLIGYGARVTKTILVDRNDPESRRKTREAMRQRMDNGYSVIVFPEGTTAMAPEIKPFRPGMFYVAAEGEIPVVPVAIEYALARDAFIGNDTFIPHFIRAFGKRRTHMRVSVGPKMHHPDGAQLQSQVQSWVETEASLLRQDFLQPSVS